MSAQGETLAYRALVTLAAPAALWLGRKQDPARWRERLGRYPESLPQRPIWLHAASLGEAKAGGLLIEALRKQGYDGPFVVTTTTATGASAIAPALGDQDRHLYAPYDSAGSVRRALDTIAPRLLLVMEVEIWPRLWQEAERRGIPILLANARLSERSASRYRRRLPGLWRDTLARATRILAQSEAIAGRYRSLGVSDERLTVTGNLKYSLQIDEHTRQQGQLLRGAFGDRPVWLAASTHEGEEAIALDAHRAVLAADPEALLVIVPRHPQRFAGVAELCRRSGLGWQQRSLDQGPVGADIQIYLADTLGELLALYGAADLTWVAGSFAAVGGHNILEPAACGCPAVVGPDMRNFADILSDFIAADALEQVQTPEALTQALCRLLGDPDRRRTLAENALALQQPLQDATETQARLILAELAAAGQKR